MAEDEENLTPEQREKLLKELKQRLREIEELKQSLHLMPQEEGEKDQGSKKDELENSPSSVRAAVEELKVPSLELLQDSPLPKKIKKEQESST